MVKNIEKYKKIMEELRKGTTQAIIIRDLECSYSTITAAKEYFSHYPNCEQLNATTLSTTPTTTEEKIIEGPREKIVDEVKINKNIQESVKNGKRPSPLHLLQELDLELCLTAINNQLIGYRKAYRNNKDNPLSETKRKYERMLKEKEKLENLLK